MMNCTAAEEQGSMGAVYGDCMEALSQKFLAKARIWAGCIYQNEKLELCPPHLLFENNDRSAEP